MKKRGNPEPTSVDSNNDNDVLHALDQSEKEYNRMISQHMTYHKMLMDDLIKLSSETGSGSIPASSPRELLQQQLVQANKINVVRGLGTTVGNLNASNQNLLKSASKFVDDGNQNAKTVSRLNNFIRQSGSKLNKNIQEYQAITAGALNTNAMNEGFSNPNPTLDAALEVSELVNESQKYALIVFGVLAIGLLYKTMKHL
jgi:hypothetical protein